MATMDRAETAPSTATTSVRVLATAALVAGLTISTVALALGLSTWGTPESFESTPFGDIGTFVFAVTLLAMGYVLRLRRPENVIGSLFLAFGIVVGLSAVAWVTMLHGYLSAGVTPIGTWAAWLGAVVTLPVWTYCILAIVIRFPNGRPSSPGEAALLRWLPIIGLIAAVATALRPGPILAFPAFGNPITTPVELHPLLVGAANVVVVAILLPCLYVGAMVVGRYRRSAGMERLQLRWFAFGASIVIVTTVIYLVFGVVAAPENDLVREGTFALFILSLSMLPISVFRAITSHHLYEIDQIISRTFAYGALTAILAGVYTASVRLFNWVFVAVTGQESEAALVITTLILATTFTPIKTRLERFAGERFKPAPAGAAGASTGDPSSSATATALTPAAAPVLDDGLDARIDARLDSQVDARVDARLEERLGAIVRRAVDDALRERDAGSPR